MAESRSPELHNGVGFCSSPGVQFCTAGTRRARYAAISSNGGATCNTVKNAITTRHSSRASAKATAATSTTTDAQSAAKSGWLLKEGHQSDSTEDGTTDHQTSLA